MGISCKLKKEVREGGKRNMPVEQIAEIVEEGLETVEQWLEGA